MENMSKMTSVGSKGTECDIVGSERECDIVVGCESERVRLARREREGWEWV